MFVLIESFTNLPGFLEPKLLVFLAERLIG